MSGVLASLHARPAAPPHRRTPAPPHRRTLATANRRGSRAPHPTPTPLLARSIARFLRPHAAGCVREALCAGSKGCAHTATLGRHYDLQPGAHCTKGRVTGKSSPRRTKAPARAGRVKSLRRRHCERHEAACIGEAGYQSIPLHC